ncbi:3-oxoacyl-[acyl-carrier-protein] synthase [Rhynchospora pubera]|uniref:3-oxoacyl-[acyl-carrier-protein] synthase n=1 Tax=Rhynchospora pubera TaxID=906938 RepID=A0AAV8DN71_9POAL|nr:3-oxoacyl-[acyl-carrier-protein] synthase [Rhynchospora pubera]
MHQSLFLPKPTLSALSQPRLLRHSLHRVSAASTTVAALRRETDPKKRVVITGMGIVSVFGNDVDKFYDKLLEGENGIDMIDGFDVSALPTKFAGEIKNFSSEGYIDRETERKYDTCWTYGVVSGMKALENAGLGCETEAFKKIDKARAGILVGTGMGGVGAFTEGFETLKDEGYQELSPALIQNITSNMGSTLLGIHTGFTGPTYSISTACATSNYCICAAANHIRKGSVDVMLAGGTEACIIPAGLTGFIACRALSQRNNDPKTASRPWDKDRDGFVMGEGAGILVMESLEHAMKRDAPIFAEYLGGAVNCDAHHITEPRADGLGVSTCIQQSLENAGVYPEEVNYINAHATSTILGDSAEVSAIKSVFKNPSQLKMNATKSLIGHCIGAAGGMEAIATIKAITNGWLHPTINQFNLDPAIEFDTVPNKKQEYEVNVAISNSFGFGGHNAVVVFAPFKP